MDTYKTQSDLLKAISHPARLAILDILRGGEQCVCHIEAALNLRQAYISQQLMTLKDAGLVESRRDGLGNLASCLATHVLLCLLSGTLKIGLLTNTYATITVPVSGMDKFQDFLYNLVPYNSARGEEGVTA